MPPVPDLDDAPNTSTTVDSVADKLANRVARWAFAIILTGLVGAAGTLGATYVQIAADRAASAEIHGTIRRDITALRQDVNAVVALQLEVRTLATKVDSSSTDTSRRLGNMEQELVRLREHQRAPGRHR